MASPRNSDAGRQKLRDHPWSPALFTALGILLAVASGLLLWGLYRVVSTYFFIFMAAICLSEALWRPKMMLMHALQLFTKARWSPRALMLTWKGLACITLVLAVLIRSFSWWESAYFGSLVGLVLALDTRVSLVFRVHRWLLTDDDLVALVCLLGMVLVAGVGIAFPFVGIANESAELAGRIGHYSEYVPEFNVAEAVKSLGLDGMVRNMGKDYGNVTWYTLVNRTVHDIVQGEFDLAAEWQEWRGNRTLWEAVTHHSQAFYKESSALDAMPAKDLAEHGAKIFSTTAMTLLTSLRGTMGLSLSIVTSLTDKAIRVCYFLSLLLYFLGRKNSVLQVLLEMLGDESELASEIQDILSGVFKYPAARMFTRFWSTCFLAYAFNVQYLWILSATTMTMSFTPISLGSYPYLVAIPWWLYGNVRGNAFIKWPYVGIRGCIRAVFPSWAAEKWNAAFHGLPGGIGESEEEFWLGLVFMTAMLVVHSWLDTVELSLFSVSKHVPPYAIGLTVLLGFEHFGIWALFYCPLMLCAATLGYRICIKGEFMHRVAAEEDLSDSEDVDDTDKANTEPADTSPLSTDPDVFLQLTRRMARSFSIAAQKVHERNPSKTSMSPRRRHTCVYGNDGGDTPGGARPILHRRGTAPALGLEQGFAAQTSLQDR